MIKHFSDFNTSLIISIISARYILGIFADLAAVDI